MFELGFFQVACCTKLESEEAGPTIVVPQPVQFVRKEDTTNKKDDWSQQGEFDLTDCSTASGSASDSETCSNGRSSSKAGADGILRGSQSNWNAVVDRCRVPKWDAAISSALDKALNSESLLKHSNGKEALNRRLRRAPDFLMVQSPNCPRSYNGTYEICPDRFANGEPLWKHTTAEYWLYSCSKGRWCIGGKDVEMAGFVRAAGFLVQTAAHEGSMPGEVDSVWQRW